MLSNLNRFACVVLLLAALGGCYKPVRHLASDAALIRVGESTRNDVLTYLGEPDEQYVAGGGVEKWMYWEHEQNVVKNAPVIGKYFGKPDYGTLTVTITDNVVTECGFGAWESDQRKWADDFDWQEEKGD